MENNDQKVQHNKVNHIMAGETRFKITNPEIQESDDLEIEIVYNWGKLTSGESSPHAGRPPEK